MKNNRQSKDPSDTNPEGRVESRSEELTAAQLDSVTGAIVAPSNNSITSSDSGDEVVVAFQSGSVRQPYILGGLWNGGSKPPETSGQ